MMEWVKKLPEVGTPMLNRVERIQELESEARALESQATSVRHKAYLDSLQLDSDVLQQWSAEEIKKARIEGAVPT